MTLDTMIMLSGVFVATLPFLGLPNSWDSVLFLITGSFVIALGIVLRRRGKSTSTPSVTQGSHFVERVPEQVVGEHGQS